MRRDAEEHRQTLVAAARTVFLKDGYGAPLAAVLAEAGLGRGTLYRQFSGRVDLIIAVFEEEFDASVEFVEANGNKPDFLERLLLFQGTNKAAYLLALGSMSDADRTEMATALLPLMAKLRIHDQEVVTLIRRNRPLRPDFDGENLRTVFLMLAGASVILPKSPLRQEADRAMDFILNGVLTGT